VEKYGTAEQGRDDNTAHAHCVLETKATDTNTHTQNMLYLLLFHYKNVYVHAPLNVTL